MQRSFLAGNMMHLPKTHQQSLIQLNYYTLVPLLMSGMTEMTRVTWMTRMTGMAGMNGMTGMTGMTRVILDD